jgi:TusA-related sulfurtransferase
LSGIRDGFERAYAGPRIIFHSLPASIMAKTGGNRNMQSDIQQAPDGIRVLDLTGMIPPLTFLKITQAFRGIKAGEIMEIIGTDPETRRNFSKILGTSSHELLHIKYKKDLYFIRLRKGRGQGH